MRLEPPCAARLGGVNLRATAILRADNEQVLAADNEQVLAADNEQVLAPDSEQVFAEGWDESAATWVAARRELHGGARQAPLAR